MAATTKTPAEREAIAAEKKLLIEAEHLKLEVRQAQRREAVFDDREILFSGDVEEYEVNTAIEMLRDYRAESDEPITIYLNSPGGYIFDGFQLYDLVREMQLGGIPIITKVFGFAASMASVLSQAGNTRLISGNSWFMVHEPATLAVGKVGDLKREVKLLENLHDQLAGILAERSNLTKADIKRRTQDKDWWMNADEALRHGFFDEVL